MMPSMRQEAILILMIDLERGLRNDEGPNGPIHELTTNYQSAGAGLPTVFVAERERAAVAFSGEALRQK